MQRKKRHPITLLEIMIVILLIGIIGGALSYNLKGTLDRGKKFRTEERIKRLKEILDLEIASGSLKKNELDKDPTKNVAKVKDCVAKSGFVDPSKVDEFLQDGWGVTLQVKLDDNSELVVSQ